MVQLTNKGILTQQLGSKVMEYRDKYRKALINRLLELDWKIEQLEPWSNEVLESCLANTIRGCEK